MRFAAASDVGLIRERNEDAFFADAEHGLFVVADGLGGHPAGDVASRAAVEDIARAADSGGAGRWLEPGAALADVLVAANDAVRSAAADEPARRGMGTTAVVAHVRPGGPEAWIAHVGDSRAYLCRDGELTRLTRDHVAERPFGGTTITQALGTSSEVSPDVALVRLQSSDRLLLCSDGLTDMVADDAITAIVADGKDPQATCDALVAAALDNGGVDNVTVVVVEVDE